jgi:transcription antitermination factor NusG
MAWCILRCSDQATMPLVKSLARAGIDLWTPVERVTKRVPRANIKRSVEQPLLPSYIFAAASHLPELFGIINAPKREHRDFRLFKHNGAIPLVADETLSPLRLLERKSKAETAQLKRGDAVRLTDGGFAGMSGEIEATGPKFAMVRLNGFPQPLRIANYYLLPNQTGLVNQAA